jgi:hypothetical protein
MNALVGVVLAFIRPLDPHHLVPGPNVQAFMDPMPFFMPSRDVTRIAASGLG